MENANRGRKMKKAVLLLMVMVLTMAACASPPAVPTPTPSPTATLTPTPVSCALMNQTYDQQVAPILDRWAQAYQVTLGTSRIALAVPIMELQKIRNEFAAVAVPNHLMESHLKVLLSLDLDLQNFLRFQVEDGCAATFYEEALRVRQESLDLLAEGIASCPSPPIPRRTITEADVNYINCWEGVLDDYEAMTDDANALKDAAMREDREAVTAYSDALLETIDRFKGEILACSEPTDQLLFNHKWYLVAGCDELSEMAHSVIGLTDTIDVMLAVVFPFGRARASFDQAACSLDVWTFKTDR